MMAQWARCDQAGSTDPRTWARRLKLLRPFTRWLQQFEPRTEVPDDAIFGRAGEEMAALRAAGISFDVVPGVTAALAAAAEAEIPLTLRDVASSLVFATGEDADGNIIGYIPRWLLVRTSTPPETLAAPIRTVIRQANPTLPVNDVNTMLDVVDRDTASRAAQVRVLAAFAAIAFALAGIGIHGLLSFSVSQRAQEIGVRVALGAQPGDILRMVLRRSAMLAVAGVIPGVVVAYLAGRSMEALLAGVAPADAVTMLAAVGLSLLMTVVGSLMPTLRALRVDPITALRAE
jgi:hypothetical protein